MKKILITTILTILLIMTACTSRESPTQYLTNEEFYKGTDALEIEFFENIPPNELLENTPFDITIKAQNNGAHYLNGYLTLSIEEDYMCVLTDNGECFEPGDLGNYDPVTINNINQAQAEFDLLMQQYTSLQLQYEAAQTEPEKKTYRDQIEALILQISEKNNFITQLKAGIIAEKSKILLFEGQSIYNPTGGQDTLTFHAQTKEIPTLTESHLSTIIATSCYDYETITTQEVCIDTDINQLSFSEQVCTAQDINLGGGQGAPLAITKIETNIIPYTDYDDTVYVRPQFIIHIQNKGNGDVVNKEKLSEACSAAGLDRYDYDLVFLEKIMLSDEYLVYRFNGYNSETHKEIEITGDTDTIECTPNPIKIDKDKDNYIRCTVNPGLIRQDQAAFTTPLYIDLDYGYTTSIAKDVTIEKSFI